MFSVSILFFGRGYLAIFTVNMSRFYGVSPNILSFVAHVNINWLLLNTRARARVLCGLAVHKICVKPLFRNLRRVITEHNGKPRLNLLLHLPQTRRATRLSRILIAGGANRRAAVYLLQNTLIIKILNDTASRARERLYFTRTLARAREVLLSRPSCSRARAHRVKIKIRWSARD